MPCRTVQRRATAIPVTGRPPTGSCCTSCSAARKRGFMRARWSTGPATPTGRLNPRARNGTISRRPSASGPDRRSGALMSTASLAASGERAAVRIDRLFLGIALATTAILVVLVLLDHQPASAALILGGFGLGIAFLKAEFSFTASWRRFLTRGEAGGLLGGLIVIAIGAFAVVPVSALSPKFGGAIAPLGPSLVIGAFVFGIGMQLANGCGSRSEERRVGKEWR